MDERIFQRTEKKETPELLVQEDYQGWRISVTETGTFYARKKLTETQEDVISGDSASEIRKVIDSSHAFELDLPKIAVLYSRLGGESAQWKPAKILRASPRPLSKSESIIVRIKYMKLFHVHIEQVNADYLVRR